MCDIVEATTPNFDPVPSILNRPILKHLKNAQFISTMSKNVL